MYKAKTFDKIRATKESLEALCRQDLRVDSILSVLNKICFNERARATSLIRERRKDFPVRHSIKLNKTYDNSFNLNLSGLDDYTQLPVSISEQQNLLKRWWKEINPYHLDFVDIHSISEKLAVVGIASDTNDARKVVFKLIGHKRSINYVEFFQLFVKSMMKGAIQSLASKVTNLFTDLEGSDKVLAYQRALVLTGLNYFKYDIDPQEGQQALKALKKLKAKKYSSRLSEDEYLKLAENFRRLCLSQEEHDGIEPSHTVI
mmetsp:Transcript_21025/g.38924  ORF Transcript_21025/g.38924 Transcript_21025/m.38924 type:complete len:260 (-) Transcript_21025:39-818(-)